MKVLADFHHADLYESLALLFEDRFGWELYRPVGMEWVTEGIWRHEYRDWFDGDVKVRDAIDIPRQYLQAWADDHDCGDWWERDDPTHPGRVFRMLTMAQARDLRPDIVLSTLVENEPGWFEFARQIGAHYGVQMGNQWANVQWSAAEFGLCSTTLPFEPWKPHVYYHQEFDTAQFAPVPSTTDIVASWVQALTDDTVEYGRFRLLASMAPDLHLGYYGHSPNRDEYWLGNNLTTAQVGQTMQAARAALHLKTWSDGYGHVIHNLFCAGKPVIATASYYADKLAGPLFIEGETSFDVQTKTADEVVAIIRRLVNDDEYHARISENAAKRFREVVNFDVDAEAIRTMLDGVLSDRAVAA